MRLPRQIYAIKHNITKRIYIGSSKSAEKRFKAHLGNLRCKKHPVEDMQSDYDKYGEDFTFAVIGEIRNYADRHWEYDLMKLFGTNVRGQGYNYKDKSVKTREA